MEFKTGETKSSYIMADNPRDARSIADQFHGQWYGGILKMSCRAVSE